MTSKKNTWNRDTNNSVDDEFGFVYDEPHKKTKRNKKSKKKGLKRKKNK